MTDRRGSRTVLLGYDLQFVPQPFDTDLKLVPRVDDELARVLSRLCRGCLDALPEPLLQFSDALVDMPQHSRGHKIEMLPRLNGGRINILSRLNGSCVNMLPHLSGYRIKMPTRLSRVRLEQVSQLRVFHRQSSYLGINRKRRS